MSEVMVREERWTRHRFPLSGGELAEKGGMACIDTSSGEVVAGQASTTLIFIGRFAETVDNSAGGSAVPCDVNLMRELVITRFVNDSGTAVASSDVGADCYILDDRTVTMATSGNSKCGRVWEVDPLKGVAVELRHGNL